MTARVTHACNAAGRFYSVSPVYVLPVTEGGGWCGRCGWKRERNRNKGRDCSLRYCGNWLAPSPLPPHSLYIYIYI